MTASDPRPLVPEDDRRRAPARRLYREVRGLGHRIALKSIRLALRRRTFRALLGLPFDPYDPEFRANPYPAYRRLRERAPVYRTPFGFWLLTRHADGVAVLSDPRFAHPEIQAKPRRRGDQDTWATFRSNSFISMNPPRHTRLRRRVAEVLTPQHIATLRPRAEAEADRLLDRLDGARRMDAIADLARELPISVIADMLGMPQDDAARGHVWAREAAAVMELLPTRHAQAQAEVSTGRLTGYFRNLVRERRARPGPDLISALVQSQGSDADEDELPATCAVLFVAGVETTVAFLGTAILTLLRHPAAWQSLRANPDGVRNAVEELLRFEPPVQLIGREAQDDVVLGGNRIRRGQTVFVVLAAANRDPERFADPERFDVRREDARPLSFGHGIHACLGQALARLEGQVVLEALVRRLPTLRLGGRPIVWRDSSVIRALDSLPVEW